MLQTMLDDSIYIFQIKNDHKEHNIENQVCTNLLEWTIMLPRLAASDNILWLAWITTYTIIYALL